MSDPFEAAGTLRDAYRSIDWTATSLGPVESWGPELLAALDLTLHTRAPVTLFWGADYTMLYNEAYVPMIGDKHPAALGSTTTEVFAEIWDTIGPMLDSVFAGRGATWVEDLRLLMNRSGFLEETYFTFSYSAVHATTGRIAGVIDIAAETTAQVLGRRRLALLARLNDKLADAEDVRQLLDRALPVLRSATEDLPGVDILLPEMQAPTVAWPAELDRDVVVETTPEGRVARIRLTGAARARSDAMLVSRISPYLAVDDAYLDFFRLLGAALAQGMNRARTRQAERRAAAMERELSEALQRSLLPAPDQPAHIEVAVRYQPAAEGVQIGGDWYDSFTLPDGSLTLVVGDVTGHDREAAVGMSQLRNLLRGISYAVGKPPAEVLGVLGEAMNGFGVDVFATALLAQVEPDTGRTRTLRWSNAGHPPPVFVSPDGSVHLLDTHPETLLGTRGRSIRTNHTVELPPGAAVVLYTDGLIERRGSSLDEGLSELVAALADAGGLTAEQLCDRLLDRFAGAAEDDVVLAVVRAHP
ncbi:PP2C family protein-serine/threonine phosphatase [Actinoplanes friuliensis]|uniref:Stage II sporulation protein E (SpoIIE) n=1 Tax=Actinoplanes friuliensis DSM 7358 TaxID=1246995 RepID=U5W3C1_9ACTN|nr:PP2C family protein-serine/threonine phosphatase [Actinoplanes friuliensis]AGZ42495.1 Stage II sporulation protein E (SpoIIE) [Actinoplanes friuliensis DSM 7358]